jgi:uncharacterized membrane protein (UPF0127 family)
MRLNKTIAPLAALSLLACGCAGCNKSAPAAPASPPPSPLAATPAASPPLATKAQQKLATTNLWIGPHVMSTELALSPNEVTTGMMFRTNMGEMEGMLFVFAVPHQTSFWMKNCPLPLSAAYIDPNGVIQEIHPLEAFNTNSVVANSENIQFVLETPQGWFDRHNVRTGTVIRTEFGTLQDTFFRKR